MFWKLIFKLKIKKKRYKIAKINLVILYIVVEAIAHDYKSIAYNLPFCTKMALTSSLVLAALVALTVQVFYFSPIDPISLELPLSVSSTKNNQLQVKT